MSQHLFKSHPVLSSLKFPTRKETSFRFSWAPHDHNRVAPDKALERTLDGKNVRVLVPLVVLFLAGCSGSDISSEISRQAAMGDRMDLTRVGGSDWDRVCFLGPYTTNAAAEKVLGFAWDVELRTDIESSDGINVLVFVTGQRVASYLEHPRHQDFWKLNGQCFRRAEATFVKEESSYVRPLAQQSIQPERETTDER